MLYKGCDDKRDTRREDRAMADYDAQEKRLVGQIDRAQARLRDMRARRSDNERKARNHALIVLGSIVLDQFDGKDWKTVSFPDVERVLARNRKAIGSLRVEELPLAEAKGRLRKFEHERRLREHEGPAEQKDGGLDEKA